jgi:hypothetical protein
MTTMWGSTERVDDRNMLSRRGYATMAVLQAFVVVVLIALGAPAWFVICLALLPVVSALSAIWNAPLNEVLTRGRSRR